MGFINKMFDRVAKYDAQCKTIKQQIERQKLMIADDKRVTLSDFVMAVHANSPENIKQNRLNSNWVDRYARMLFLAIVKEKADERGIKINGTEAVSRSILKYAIEILGRHKLTDKSLANHETLVDYGLNIVDPNYSNDAKRVATLPLSSAMESFSLTHERLEAKRNTSIVFGNAGREILEFYERINGLDPYNRYCKDSPSNRGGEPKRRSDIRLQPSYGQGTSRAIPFDDRMFPFGD